MIRTDAETNTLTISFPFEKTSNSEAFDIVKSINVNIYDCRYVPHHDIIQYITYSECYELDNIIDNIANGVNNYPNQIKINLYVYYSDKCATYQYFIIKLMDKINILPRISLTISNNESLRDINNILADIDVTKLVFNDFELDIIDDVISIDWGTNITKLVLYGQDNEGHLFFNKIDSFLNKFPNLKSIITNQIYVNPHKSLDKANFNLEKIDTDSVEIFIFATPTLVSQSTNLKKITVDFTEYESKVDIFISHINRIISANNNISYLKLITGWCEDKRLNELAVKKLQVLPLEYINVDGFLISLVDTINIAKYNNNIKHCTFYSPNCTECMSVLEFVNEIPDIININTNIESLEFVYAEIENDIAYPNFIIEILYKLINSNVDDNIKSLKFNPQLCDYSIPMNIIFNILNKFSNLQSIDIRYKYAIDNENNLEDLLVLLINNQTIKSVILSDICNIYEKVFTNTNFFNFNYTLCYLGCGFPSNAIQHEGFTRNRKLGDEKRFKKIKMIDNI